MHRRIRRAYRSLLEHGCTKIASIGCISSSLDVMIAKVTSPDDVPLPETCVWELAIALSTSSSSSRSFVTAFTRRFGTTRSWRVALKCLLLLHRLLRTLPSCHPLRCDLLMARADALVSFHPCYFRDASSEDYTTFICSYSRLLDGVLTCCQYSITPPTSPGSVATDSHERTKEAGQALELLQQLQSLANRAMDCVPSGVAAHNFLIRSAMEQVARESFACYLASRCTLTVMLDGILNLPYRSCFEGLALYRRTAKLAIRLGEFYRLCRSTGLCGAYEYPLIDKIPESQVRMLEAFVEKMWSTTESSSMSSDVEKMWPTTESSSMSQEEEGDNRLTTSTAMKVVITEEWEKFDSESGLKEEEPLIQFEQDAANWEVLLESSVGWNGRE